MVLWDKPLWFFTKAENTKLSCNLTRRKEGKISTTGFGGV